MSIQQDRNVFPHTLTSTDIPRPLIHDTGPGEPGWCMRYHIPVFELLGFRVNFICQRTSSSPEGGVTGGSVRVELSVADLELLGDSSSKMVVSSTAAAFQFDWSTTITESDNLSIVVDIDIVTTFEYR